MDAARDGAGLYVTLGQHRGTLSLYTERSFEELASRIETEFESDEEALRFELQFYSLASRVDVDTQGRFVLPDQLVKKAGLKEEVCLLGQKNRIDVWNRADYERQLGVNWEDETWPRWGGFVRRRPANGVERPK
jgi:MraZ protein